MVPTKSMFNTGTYFWIDIINKSSQVNCCNSIHNHEYHFFYYHDSKFFTIAKLYISQQTIIAIHGCSYSHS